MKFHFGSEREWNWEREKRDVLVCIMLFVIWNRKTIIILQWIFWVFDWNSKKSYEWNETVSSRIGLSSSQNTYDKCNYGNMRLLSDLKQQTIIIWQLIFWLFDGMVRIPMHERRLWEVGLDYHHHETHTTCAIMVMCDYFSKFFI